MRILINRSLCDGNGLCAKAAPLLLALDVNDSPQILLESFDEEQAGAARQAVKSCPKAALSLSESDTSKR
jgi:ferredoxin